MKASNQQCTFSADETFDDCEIPMQEEDWKEQLTKVTVTQRAKMLTVSLWLQKSVGDFGLQLHIYICLFSIVQCTLAPQFIKVSHS